MLYPINNTLSANPGQRPPERTSDGGSLNSGNYSSNLPNSMLICPPADITRVYLPDILRINDPNLHPDDRALIIRYANCRNENDRKMVLNLIYQKIAELGNLELSTYDGKRDDSQSKIALRINSLLWALAVVLGEKKVKGLQKRAAKAVFEGAKTWFTPDNLRKIEEITSWDDDKLKAQLAVSADLYNYAPFGSESKRNLYVFDKILNYFAAAERDLSYKEKSMYLFARTLPDTSKIAFEQFYKRIDHYSTLQNYPDKSCILQQKNCYMEEIVRIIDQYIAISDPLTRATLESILDQYLQFAQDIGMTRQELDDIARPLRHQGLGRKISLAEIKELGFIELSPADLPAQTQEILKRHGYWDRVSRALKITLVHQAFLSPLVAEVFWGAHATNKFAGLITVDVQEEGESNRIISEEELALCLTHEATHLSWFYENYDKPRKLMPTPNERAAFVVQADLGRKMLREGIKDPVVRDKIIQAVAEAEICVENADYILSQTVPEFPDEYLYRNAQGELDRIDLSIYPSKIGKPPTEEELRAFEQALGRGKLPNIEVWPVTPGKTPDGQVMTLWDCFVQFRYTLRFDKVAREFRPR